MPVGADPVAADRVAAGVRDVIEVADARDPGLLARLRVDGHRLRVEGVVEDPPPRVGGAPVHDVAAGHALRGRHHLGTVGPLRGRARPGEVEGVEDVGRGRRVRGDDVQGAVHDQRRALVALGDAGGERPRHLEAAHVRGVDLVQPAEARARVVLGRDEPLAVVGGKGRGGGDEAGRRHRRPRGGHRRVHVAAARTAAQKGQGERGHGDRTSSASPPMMTHAHPAMHRSPGGSSRSTCITAARRQGGAGRALSPGSHAPEPP